MARSTRPLASGSAGRTELDAPRHSRHGTPGTRRSGVAGPAVQRPMHASWSHTHSRGTAPNWPSTWPIPPNTSSAVRDGTIQPPISRENPVTPTTVHCLASWPCPTGIARRAATDPTGPARPADSRCAGTDPVAGTTGAAPAPVPSGSSSHAPSRSARRSPSPASPGTRPTAPGSPARPRRPATPSRSLIARRLIRAQRLTHRVAGHTQPAHDRLDAHPLGPMQPTDLGPLLHVDHSPNPLTQSRQGTSPALPVVDPPRRGSEFGRR